MRNGSSPLRLQNEFQHHDVRRISGGGWAYHRRHHRHGRAYRAASPGTTEFRSEKSDSNGRRRISPSTGRFFGSHHYHIRTSRVPLRRDGSILPGAVTYHGGKSGH